MFSTPCYIDISAVSQIPSQCISQKDKWITPIILLNDWYYKKVHKVNQLLQQLFFAHSVHWQNMLHYGLVWIDTWEGRLAQAACQAVDFWIDVPGGSSQVRPPSKHPLSATLLLSSTP